MESIWKFSLEVADKQAVHMPVKAKVLCVQSQHDQPCIWALCDTNAPSVERTFAVYGTGHQHEQIKGEYVGTCQCHGGALVWHVFELK